MQVGAELPQNQQNPMNLCIMINEKVQIELRNQKSEIWDIYFFMSYSGEEIRWFSVLIRENTFLECKLEKSAKSEELVIQQLITEI